MQTWISCIIWRLLDITSRAFSKLSRIAGEVGTQFEPEDLQEEKVKGSTWYDMVTAPDEPYYAEQYWQIIFPHLQSLPLSANCLDLGCSQGRFSLQLAKYFHQGRITACDISGDALQAARDYAEDQGLKNVEFRFQSIRDCVSSFSGVDLVDVILMTEVTFFYPQWQKDMPRIVEILKPGGILAMSFRSQYFYGLCVVRQRVWETAGLLLNKKKGRVFRGTMEFTWQQSSEIRELFSDRNGLRLLELVGIGCCSGIPGDPHDQICRPSKINHDEKMKLMRLELTLGRSVPDAGRYMLAIGKKC